MSLQVGGQNARRLDKGCIGEPNSQGHAHMQRGARLYKLAAKPSSLLLWLEETRFREFLLVEDCGVDG